MKNTRLIPFLWILFLHSFHACTPVRLIAEHDPVTEQKLSVLQDKTSRFFVQLERSEDSTDMRYQKHKKFYEDIFTQLEVLELRTKAIPKSDIIQDQIISLRKQFTDLESLHKLGFREATELFPAKNAINSAYISILKLQSALKKRL